MSSFVLGTALLLGCGAEDTTQEVSTAKPEELVSTTGAYHVQVAPDGALKAGKNRLRASFVSPRSGSVVAASAFMPAHGHGTQGAKVTRVGSDFLIDDISMFMSGKWEIKLSLRGGEKDDELRFYVDVP
ncbi:MAG: hypothetical protein U0174_11570 [Polyangiaceae bacterium]